MAQTQRFSFLSAGPEFRVSLPDEFSSIPDLSSPLTIDNGYMARSFDFVAVERDRGVVEEHRRLPVLRDPQGREVELYERVELPRQWYLRWVLKSGSLYTHIREEDGLERAEGYVKNLQIIERPGRAAFLLPLPPLGHGASARPGYQEVAVFRAAARTGWAVIFQRPAYLAQRKVMRMPGTEDVALRSGTRLGLEVVVHSGRDLAGGQQLIEEVLDTLVGA